MVYFLEVEGLNSVHINKYINWKSKQFTFKNHISAYWRTLADIEKKDKRRRKGYFCTGTAIIIKPLKM